MKEALSHLDTNEIQALDLDCDIDGGSDGPTTTDQELPAGPHSTSLADFESCMYQLPPMLSNRLAPEHLPRPYFQHSPTDKR